MARDEIALPSAFPAVRPEGVEVTLSDPARLNALFNSGLLDKGFDASLNRFVELASEALGIPVSLVSAVDDHRQVFAAQTGLPDPVSSEAETPLSHSYCQYVVHSDAPLAVEDSRVHPLLRDNGATHDLSVIAYLGMPFHDANGVVLGSFCAIDDKPRNWSERDHRMLAGLCAMLEAELRLRRELQNRDVLAREMAHRIKNLFTIIRSVISMSARNATDTQSMAQTILGRLTALWQAHDVVHPGSDPNAIADREDRTLHALTTRLLSPYADPNTDRVNIAGPKITLGARAAKHLALALHEAATNAAKYGAISTPAGQLDVTWQVVGDTLRLNWTETGGPRITGTPDQQGFGSRLLELSVRSDLSGELTYSWQPEGLRLQISLPLKSLAL